MGKIGLGPLKESDAIFLYLMLFSDTFSRFVRSRSRPCPKLSLNRITICFCLPATSLHHFKGVGMASDAPEYHTPSHCIATITS